MEPAHNMSTNVSTEETIREVSEAKGGLGLFPDMMDIFSRESDLIGKIPKLFKTVLARIEDLYKRVAILENQAEKRNPPSKRLDWKDLTCLAEFRIAEHSGHLTQRELQRSLDIRSRTTITQLVNILRQSGRYTVRKDGRRNIIERLQ